MTPALLQVYNTRNQESLLILFDVRALEDLRALRAAFQEYSDVIAAFGENHYLLELRPGAARRLEQRAEEGGR